jgi:EAL and modified HD-GYP domain-containing signal transduction protein
VAACRKLKAAGFKLALDNVISRRQVERLLPHCDFIKVDLQAVEPAKRGHLIREFAGHEQKLIAGKVETAEDFALAVSLGCRYVQGYFFCRPEVLKGKGLAGIEQVYLQLLGELKQPQLDFARVESLIKRDVSLSYKLLRYMDTAAVAVGRRVTSVQDALAVLGEQPLRKWLALVCFTSLSRKKPSELLLTCLVRGNFCEAIAKATHLADRQLEAFFIGLLSGIEAVLDMPLDALVKQMTLPDEVRAVLLGQPGANEDLVRVYTLAQACERGAWGTVIQASARLRLTQSEVALIYYDALGWANQALHEEKK